MDWRYGWKKTDLRSEEQRQQSLHSHTYVAIDVELTRCDISKLDYNYGWMDLFFQGLPFVDATGSFLMLQAQFRQHLGLLPWRREASVDATDFFLTISLPFQWKTRSLCRCDMLMHATFINFFGETTWTRACRSNWTNDRMIIIDSNLLSPRTVTATSKTYM